MRHIRYCINRDDGMVYSLVGKEIAVAVLQWDKIGENGNFTKPLEYELEKMPALSLADIWPRLRWTKKIPQPIKDRHREFWGFR